jgi:hypothetical protein
VPERPGVELGKLGGRYSPANQDFRAGLALPEELSKTLRFGG